MNKKEKKENVVISQVYKAAEWVIIAFLYIVFLYWVTQSFNKYMDEPTITSIKG